jgi:hypothetical protein
MIKFRQLRGAERNNHSWMYCAEANCFNNTKCIVFVEQMASFLAMTKT